MKRYRALADRIFVCIALLALWQVASWILGTYWVSTPWATISRFFISLWDGELIRHAGYTVEEAVLGGVIGAVPAIILPFVLRRFPTIVQIIDPFMIGGYGLPKLALAPLFILWFGIGIEFEDRRCRQHRLLHRILRDALGRACARCTAGADGAALRRQ